MSRGRSIEQYERRRRCWLPRCREPRAPHTPFCEAHMDALPDDLLYRLSWTYDDGDTTEWLAAIRAAVEYLTER